jgi:hypothetical protein
MNELAEIGWGENIFSVYVEKLFCAPHSKFVSDKGENDLVVFEEIIYLFQK